MVFSGLCKLVLSSFRVFELPRCQSFSASLPKVEINYTRTWQCDMMSSENSNDQPKQQPMTEVTFGGEAYKPVNDMPTVKPSKSIGGLDLLVSSFVATTATHYNWSSACPCPQAGDGLYLTSTTISRAYYLPSDSEATKDCSLAGGHGGPGYWGLGGAPRAGSKN